MEQVLVAVEGNPISERSRRHRKMSQKFIHIFENSEVDDDIKKVTHFVDHLARAPGGNSPSKTKFQTRPNTVKQEPQPKRVSHQHDTVCQEDNEQEDIEQEDVSSTQEKVPPASPPAVRAGSSTESSPGSSAVEPFFKGRRGRPPKPIKVRIPLDKVTLHAWTQTGAVTSPPPSEVVSTARGTATSEAPCSHVRPEQPQCALQVVTRLRRRTEQEKLKAAGEQCAHSPSSQSSASPPQPASLVGGVDKQLSTLSQMLTHVSTQVSGPPTKLAMVVNSPELHTTTSVPAPTPTPSVHLGMPSLRLTPLAPNLLESPLEVPTSVSKHLRPLSSKAHDHKPSNVACVAAISKLVQLKLPEPDNVSMKTIPGARLILPIPSPEPANLSLLSPSTALMSPVSTLPAKPLLMSPKLLNASPTFTNPPTKVENFLPTLPNRSPSLLNPALQLCNHHSKMPNLPNPAPGLPDSLVELPSRPLGSSAPPLSLVVPNPSHTDAMALPVMPPPSTVSTQSTACSVPSVTGAIAQNVGIAFPANLQTPALSAVCLPVDLSLETAGSDNTNEALCVSFQKNLLGQCWQRIELLKQRVALQHESLYTQKDEIEADLDCEKSNLLVSVPLSKVSMSLQVAPPSVSLVNLAGTSCGVSSVDVQPLDCAPALPVPHLPACDVSEVNSNPPPNVSQNSSHLHVFDDQSQQSNSDVSLEKLSLSMQQQQQQQQPSSVSNQGVNSEADSLETKSVDNHPSPGVHASNFAEDDCSVRETIATLSEREAKAHEVTTTAREPINSTQEAATAVVALAACNPANPSTFSSPVKPCAMSDSNLESNEVLDSSGDISSDPTPEKKKVVEPAVPPNTVGVRPSREVAMQKRCAKAFLYDESIIDLIFDDQDGSPRAKHSAAKHSVQQTSQEREKSKAKKAVKSKGGTVEPVVQHRPSDSPRTLRQRKGSALPLALRTKSTSQKQKGNALPPSEEKDEPLAKRPKTNDSKLSDSLKLTFQKLPKNDKTGGRYVVKSNEEALAHPAKVTAGGGGKSKGGKRVMLAPPAPREKNYWKHAQAWLPRNVPATRTSVYAMRQTAHLLRAWKVDKKWMDENNRWKWLGDAIAMEKYKEKSKVVTRQYFIGMRRGMKFAESVYVRDCVLVFSGDSEQFPYIGRILSFWQDSNSDEMMFTCTWYHRPQDVLSTSLAELYGEKELFASSHRDDNPVASILNKCYVMSYNEYCRFHATLALHQARAASTPPLAAQVVPTPDALEVPRFHIPDAKTLEDSTHVYYCKTSLLSARYNSNRLKVLTQTLGGVKASGGKRMSLLKSYSTKSTSPPP